MRQIIFLEILKRLKQKPSLMRKAKMFAVVGLIGFVLVGSLTIWAGISAVKYVASTAHQAVLSPTAQTHIQDAKGELQQIRFQPLNCWGKAQTLLTLQPWVEKSALDNFRKLKVACLENKPAVCEGHTCEQMKELMHTAEGKTI